MGEQAILIGMGLNIGLLLVNFMLGISLYFFFKESKQVVEKNTKAFVMVMKKLRNKRGV